MDDDRRGRQPGSRIGASFVNRCELWSRCLTCQHLEFSADFATQALWRPFENVRKRVTGAFSCPRLVRPPQLSSSPPCLSPFSDYASTTSVQALDSTHSPDSVIQPESGTNASGLETELNVDGQSYDSKVETLKDYFRKAAGELWPKLTTLMTKSFMCSSLVLRTHRLPNFRQNVCLEVMLKIVR